MVGRVALLAATGMEVAREAGAVVGLLDHERHERARKRVQVRGLLALARDLLAAVCPWGRGGGRILDWGRDLPLMGRVRVRFDLGCNISYNKHRTYVLPQG